MTLLAEILTKKKAGEPFLHLLKKEKTLEKSGELCEKTIKKLRGKPWLIYPEDYEVSCPICSEKIIPLYPEGSFLKCRECGRNTCVMEEASIGKSWIRFYGCEHIVEVQQGLELGACIRCNGKSPDDRGAFYEECPVSRPKRNSRDQKIRERIVQEIKEYPWTVFPEKHVVDCVWKECYDQNKSFELTRIENDCARCPNCTRLVPIRLHSDHTWYYFPCKHMERLKVGNGVMQCPKCGNTGKGTKSAVAIPRWK